MRGGVDRRVAEDDVDLEVGGHLVDEADRLTAHLPRGALQPGQLAAQVVGAVGRQAGGVELAEQAAGLVAQLPCGVGAGSSATSARIRGSPV